MILQHRWRPALLAACLLTFASMAHAQDSRMGVHAGYNVGDSDAFLGLTGQFGLTVGDTDVMAALTAELYPFLDELTVTVVDLNALLPVRVAGLIVYAGPGMTFRMESYPSDTSETESDTMIGLSLKAGMVLGSDDSGFRPFVEVDQTVGAGTTVSVRGGVLFTLGGGR